MSNLPKGRKLVDDRLVNIIEEVGNRFNIDTVMSKNTNRLINIMRVNKITNEKLIDGIQEVYIENSTHLVSINLLEFLGQFGQDLTKLLKTAEERGVFSESKANFLIRVKLLLSHNNKEGMYQHWLDLIENKLKELGQDESDVAIGYLVESTCLKYDRDLSMKLIDQALQNNNWTKELFHLIKNRFLTTYACKKVNELKENSLHNAQDFAFLNRLLIGNWNPVQQQNLANMKDRSMLYLNIIKKNLEIFNGERLLNLFHNNPKALLDLAINCELHFKQIVKLITDDYKLKYAVEQTTDNEGNQKRTVSLAIVINTFCMIQRLLQNGYFSSILSIHLKNIYTDFKAAGKRMNLELESAICNHLLTYNLLEVEAAEAIYASVSQKDFINDNVKEQYYTYILRKKKDYENNDELLEEANGKIVLLEGKLQTVDAKVVLNELSKIMSYPFSFIQHNQDLYLTALRDHISFGNTNNYLSVLYSIPESEVQNNRQFYFPFLRELGNYYSNFSKKMKVGDIAKCLDKFVKFRIKSIPLYNQILNDIARNFNSMRSQDHVRVVAAFSQMSLKQSDLFDRILLKISLDLKSFFPFLGSLLNNWFKVNYDSVLYKEKIDKWRGLTIRAEYVNLLLIKTILTLSLENEEEYLQDYFDKLEISTSNNSNYERFFNRGLIKVYNILKVDYPEKPWADTIKSKIQNFEEIEQEEANSIYTVNELIAEY